MLCLTSGINKQILLEYCYYFDACADVFVSVEWYIVQIQMISER